MQRYGSLDYVLSLDADDAIDFIAHAFQKRDEEKLWQRWLVGYQFEMSFDEFRLRLTPSKPKKDEEVIEDAFSIIAMVNGGEKP